MGEQVLWICTMIGSISCGVSGALMAVDKGLDLLGVVILGCVTAVGGGMLRDVLLGITPPAVFSQSEFVLAAAIASLCVFLFAYWLYARIRDWNEVAATGVGIGAVVLVRLLASHFRWSLPRVHRPEDDAAPELPSRAEKDAKN